ncbi:hypothetical protein MD588_07815 [Photobacterium sp. SDRW27]|uniref:hypothetical protein n=1 Tax=Photobacterium obscurum TaxID=2829490 RepID=UPI002243B787|nr:hypothetical protein [Photobacterium obscurum]MCW8328713.1 hypothetical protein [Photobacterium obscurum]
MKPLLIVILLVLLVSAEIKAATVEYSGYVATETSLFAQATKFSEQSQHSVSVATQPELYQEWDSGTSFTFVPFGRLDSADSERSHVDIRELNVLLLDGNWEMRLGLGKVFWGVTEFVHLVDIINQTDLVENINAEEKLGQPMVHFTLIKDWGVAELFVLPYFRERTFPGVNGRLRTELVVDTDRARYESSAEQHHTDLSVRYSHTYGELDLGLHYFTGTGREPTLLPLSDSGGQLVLIPFYEQINQIGTDIQLVAGEWLWKLEALYRNGQGDGYTAVAGGFEYTFVGIVDTAMDLGVITEYVYDSRGNRATTPFQNDVVIGLRWAVNDLNDSTLLAGWLQDLENPAKIFQIEASRRLSDQWKVELELRTFQDLPKSDPIYSLSDDDHLKLELAYYF